MVKFLLNHLCLWSVYLKAAHNKVFLVSFDFFFCQLYHFVTSKSKLVNHKKLKGLYLVYKWFQPAQQDEYVPLKKNYIEDLKYVSLHPSEIKLENINDCVAEMRKVFRSNVTRPLSGRKDQLANLLRLLDENEKVIIQAIEKDLGRGEFMSLCYDILPTKADIKKHIKNLEKWAAPDRISFVFVCMCFLLFVFFFFCVLLFE
ncbi:hypothetical protein RFI_06742 [Reticulomyxa filosa]|uniref:Uncharacterized protein n=1 Tax=Reticulomyxa filosa TaxID=46433 RepID=X6NX03_RETFI|nr:hypothetical protein RFI_06742 [Reticulomyxa filosa]|eukprot:ETO30378.1 hypothetical protein RFI_06742 [Reticulomyxa filosa]